MIAAPHGKAPTRGVATQSTASPALLGAYVVNLAVNFLAQAGFLGKSIIEQQAAYPTPLTPAIWAFSIWSLIYTAQGAGVFYLFRKADGKGPVGDLKGDILGEVCPWWIAGWLFQCAWLISFAQDTKASLVICAGVLIAASVCFHKALDNVRHVLARAKDPPRIFTQLFLWPSAVNAAWVSVATCLGILIAVLATSFMPDLVPLSVGLAGSVFALGAFQTIKHRDAAYALTLIWSFLAIYQGQQGVPAVRNTALAAVALLTVCIPSAVRRSDEGLQSA